MNIITTTIAGLLIAGSLLHAQEITAEDLGLSNAGDLKHYTLNRTTILRHHEEERVIKERQRQREIDRAVATYYAIKARGEMIAQWNKEDQEALQARQNLMALEGIQRELRDQNYILREARDHRDDCDRPYFFNDCRRRY